MSRQTMRLDGFKPEFLDFEKGIRVGHLEPRERITQILKLSLEEKYQQVFVTDRWGRGVYWQWICFLPKANRTAKPVSSRNNFGCSKFFIMIDREGKLFKAGLQVERGFLSSERYPDCRLCDDWDWHRLVGALRDSRAFMRELRRLTSEDFHIQAGSWEQPVRYSGPELPSGEEIRRVLDEIPGETWGGFQLYYGLTPEEVRAATGSDLAESMLAIFEEVTPAMNFCMQAPLCLHDAQRV